MVSEEPSKEELEAMYCWERDDAVPGRPEMTAFRRRVRLHQARWRESKGHPIGSQPIVPRKRKPSRLVGSRLPLEYARQTGANFVTAAAFDTARARTSVAEPRQSFDHQRLWADLLWSPTLAFNLFGELAADRALADRAVHSWWPDTPGMVCDVRFAHSPGRLDTAYTGSLVDFDAAFVLEFGDGTQGIVGVAARYHERSKRALPKPARLPRYVEITEQAGVFESKAVDALAGTDLLVLWLGHLLVLSMLQHPDDAWKWGRFVVVHPAGNTDFADQCARYERLLTDRATFASTTVEELLDGGALSKPTIGALRDRYCVG